jgi:hypothetical protein
MTTTDYNIFFVDGPLAGEERAINGHGRITLPVEVSVNPERITYTVSRENGALVGRVYTRSRR